MQDEFKDDNKVAVEDSSRIPNEVVGRQLK